MAYKLYETNDDAESYSTYYLEHPDDLFDSIQKYCSSSTFNEEPIGFDLAVDLGCGDGHSTFPLTRFFKKVIGKDISATLIDKAMSKIPDGSRDVTFKVGAGEDLDFLEDSSVDLVSVGMAIHWMDTETLHHSIIRVLKPGGSVVAYGIMKMTLDKNEADDYVNKLYTDTIIPATGLPLERALIKGDFLIPFEETERRDRMEVKKIWSIERFMNFFKIISANRSMLKMYPNTTVYDEMSERLKDVYEGRHDQLGVTFTYFILFSRKPHKLVKAI